MTVYTIRIKGYLDQRWSVWLDGMTVTNEENGELSNCAVAMPDGKLIYGDCVAFW